MLILCLVLSLLMQEKLHNWILRQQENGIRVMSGDVLAYMQVSSPSLVDYFEFTIVYMHPLFLYGALLGFVIIFTRTYVVWG